MFFGTFRSLLSLAYQLSVKPTSNVAGLISAATKTLLHTASEVCPTAESVSGTAVGPVVADTTARQGSVREVRDPFLTTTLRHGSRNEAVW